MPECYIHTHKSLFKEQGAGTGLSALGTTHREGVRPGAQPLLALGQCCQQTPEDNCQPRHSPLLLCNSTQIQASKSLNQLCLL